MRITIVAGLLLCAAGVIGPRAGQAQDIRLDLEQDALEGGLAQLRAQTGVDIVFAERLVRDRRATCRYRGGEPAEALACLLEGTGLQAERVRRRQYVLVPQPAAPPGEAEGPAPRGLLAGFVSDAETGETLPGAHVYLSGFRTGTTTNAAGYFAIPSLPVGEYRVRFSYLGYAVQDTVLAAGAAPAQLRLVPKPLESETVIVEAGRSDVDHTAAVPGVVAAPVRQLERLPSFPGGQDLFRAMQWFPGIRKVGEVNGGLVIRGGAPDQNLYLLDGAPVYHPWHAFSLISTFQTETFKDIKLFRGTFPAEYGGRLAGVLDAQMRDGGRSGPRAVAALSTLSGRFLIEAPFTRNSSFMVSGRRSYLDKLIGREHPVRDDLGRRDTLRTGYYFYDVSAKFTVHADPRHRVSFSFYDGGDNLDLRLPFDFSLDFSSWLRPSDLFFEVDQDWTNQLFSLRYQYLHAERLFITTTAYQATYRADEGGFIQPTGTTALASEYRVRMNDLGLRVSADYYRSLAHQVQVGLHVVEHRFESRLDAVLQHAVNTVDTLAERSAQRDVEVAGYVQDVWKPSPRLQVLPGLRASFFSGGRYFELSPRLSAQYALDKEYLVLRMGLGRQVQFVQRLRDRFSFLYDLASSRWIPASGAVRPATSLQATFGVESRPLSWVQATAEVYWRQARDVLLPQDVFQTKSGLEGPGIEVGALLGQYTPGRSRAYGLEVAVQAERGPWTTWLSYAGGRVLNRAPELGEETYSPSRFDVPRALTGVLQRTGRRWEIGLSVEWRSGYPYAVPVARYELGDPLGDEPVRYLYRPDVNNGRLPPYFRTDVSAGYRFEGLGARWQLQLHVFNVTNNRNVIGWAFDPEKDVLEVEARRGLPLLPYLELKMEL